MCFVNPRGIIQYRKQFFSIGNIQPQPGGDKAFGVVAAIVDSHGFAGYRVAIEMSGVAIYICEADVFGLLIQNGKRIVQGKLTYKK
jgi:hypothetical protein